MKLLLLVLLAVVLFTALVGAFLKWNKDALFVLGIGSVVGANVYNIGNYSFSLGSFVFGVDSVVYTLFMFCVLLVFLLFDRKQGYAFMWTSVGSIMFTAVLQFVASWICGGIAEEMVWGFISFCVSAVATFTAVFCMHFFKRMLDGVNAYLMIVCCLIVASLVNSLIYFGVMAIIEGGVGGNFVGVIMGSYVGKFISIGFACLAWFVIAKIKKPVIIDELLIENKKKIEANEE